MINVHEDGYANYIVGGGMKVRTKTTGKKVGLWVRGVHHRKETLGRDVSMV